MEVVGVPLLADQSLTTLGGTLEVLATALVPLGDANAGTTGWDWAGGSSGWTDGDRGGGWTNGGGGRGGGGGWTNGGRGGGSGWASAGDQSGWGSSGAGGHGGGGGAAGDWSGSGRTRRPNLWTRNDVAGWDWVVDVDEDSWVRGLVSSWELDGWARNSVSSVDNVELGTAHVVLSTVHSSSGVEPNVLESQKVASAGGILWNVKVPWASGVVPGNARAGDGGSTELKDLEPVSVSVPAADVNTRWSLC